jgi:phage-related protein
LSYDPIARRQLSISGLKNAKSFDRVKGTISKQARQSPYFIPKKMPFRIKKSEFNLGSLSIIENMPKIAYPGPRMNGLEKRPEAKPIVWLGNSLENVRGFPEEVRNEIGFALYQAQLGHKHINAKPLKDWAPGVLEIISDFHNDTFRAVYTVRLAKRIYVLHAFQKKSKRGIATPKPDIELMKKRLKWAIELHSERGN